ncbi:MAG: energy transducer TonB [bacterium]|nr:energy transducer TonB [bacterium]
MKIIHARFPDSLLSMLAHHRIRQERFRKLVHDQPTGIRIQTRTRNPEADLKNAYSKRFAQASLLSTVLILAIFFLYPEHHPTIMMGSAPNPVIRFEHIPETTQTRRPPPPPRPSVPIAVEGEEVPEDVTIETTELDLDAMPLDLKLTGPTLTGPPSDEPLDISEIEYKPHPIRIVAPEYPRLAHKNKEEGEVMVKVLVDKNGRVEYISGPVVFRDAALGAARQFRFRPGRHEGERRKVWMYMPISFKLN